MPEHANRLWPSGDVSHGVNRRRGSPRDRIVFQRLALTLIELPDRGLESARQAIELAGGRIAKAAIEQRGADPRGRGERQDRGGEKGGDQAVAKSVHARPCITAGPGTARPLSSETFSHWPGGGSACRLCPAASGPRP